MLQQCEAQNRVQRSTGCRSTACSSTACSSTGISISTIMQQAQQAVAAVLPRRCTGCAPCMAGGQSALSANKHEPSSCGWMLPGLDAARLLMQ